ncbi:hypothetical protein WMY93_001010 [Mugilogobius chulae]|uniref:NACHT domain-containing protein n=1 Tax=Mugilogobius chulae TaxID=88201 RepID=A0AAW0QBJ4_9GOBI
MTCSVLIVSLDRRVKLKLESAVGVCKNKLKSHLQQKFSRVFEGVAKAGDSAPLNQIYTELYITEGGASEVNQEHEVRLMESASRRAAAPEKTITCEDIFKARPHSPEPIRVVLTKGVAGVGKTVLTQKFSLDWAEGRANQELQLLFPFTFRELNVLRDTQFSLVQLLHHFFSPSKALCSFQQLQVLFIFDGLDECRLPLDFSRTRVLTDPTESVSVDVLLVNLIRGSLLPSALLWITTRPAAANQIPAECVSMVTEVRGFTDLQKELYFRKRFTDDTIISHIKSIRSLYIMSHIPVFCWILSTVIQKLLEQTEEPELPGLSHRCTSTSWWCRPKSRTSSISRDQEQTFTGLQRPGRCLSLCGLSPHCCGPLASVLSSSSLTHLDLSHNDLQDSGVELLCDGLKSAPCRLETLSLSLCGLSPHCCGSLASVLSSSSLTHLDLSNNDLQDSGVELLLSGCLVSQRGGAALASALSSAHSHLTELDLSYNHPGPSAELLTALRDDPHCPWTLSVSPHFPFCCRVGPRHSCEFSLDPNTAHRKLKLSEDKRTLTCVREDQQYPHHEDRFTDFPQVLSCTGLRGRCYWETNTPLLLLHSSGRVSVLLDSEAGSLSFYDVDSDGKLSHIHTSSCSFTEPLFSGFRLFEGSSVSVVDLRRAPPGGPL